VTEFFTSFHQLWQYVTLFALLVSLVFTFQPLMSGRAETTYRMTTVAVDIQVLLGIIVWLGESGWGLGFMQGWLHPIVGLTALGVLHAFVARGRKGHPEVAQRTVRLGIGLTFVLVIVAIVIAALT
jgi:hypothetical protein